MIDESCEVAPSLRIEHRAVVQIEHEPSSVLKTLVLVDEKETNPKIKTILVRVAQVGLFECDNLACVFPDETTFANRLVEEHAFAVNGRAKKE